MKEETDPEIRPRTDGDGRPEPPPEPRRVFSPEAAYHHHPYPRRPGRPHPDVRISFAAQFPFPAAAKTGTSKDFRDNWTVGYTPRYTVGVWAGNFDGTPMHNVSGITGAGRCSGTSCFLSAVGPKTKNSRSQKILSTPRSVRCRENSLDRVPERDRRNLHPRHRAQAYCRLSHKKELSQPRS